MQFHDRRKIFVPIGRNGTGDSSSPNEMGSSTATPIRLEFLIRSPGAKAVKGALGAIEQELQSISTRGSKFLDGLAQRAERTAKPFERLSTAPSGVGGAVAGQVSAQSYALGATASYLRGANIRNSPVASRAGASSIAPVPAGFLTTTNGTVSANAMNAPAPARVNPATAWMGDVHQI